MLEEPPEGLHSPREPRELTHRLSLLPPTINLATSAGWKAANGGHWVYRGEYCPHEEGILIQFNLNIHSMKVVIMPSQHTKINNMVEIMTTSSTL